LLRVLLVRLGQVPVDPAARLSLRRELMAVLIDAQWIKIRGWISLMSRGEEIGAWMQTSKIESDGEVGMKSLNLSDCTSFRVI
jgi:hypothetical protein